jgi:serine/threonine protein kinase
MPPQPIHPRYIPLDPSEPQTTTSSSIRVLRTSDQALFLASKIPTILTKDIKKDSTTTNLASCILPTAAIPLSLILNHPNIISLVDIIQNSASEGSTSQRGPYGDIIVWEDMTAGSLSYLLPDPSTYPPFTDYHSWKTLAAQNFNRFSLPESLCWHVLKAISRALLWLHYGVKDSDGMTGEWEECDEDWQTVLIMDVSPSQIWFKRVRGEETYGECKLGGFGRARVMQGKGGGVEDVKREKQLYWAPVSY